MMLTVVLLISVLINVISSETTFSTRRLEKHSVLNSCPNSCSGNGVCMGTVCNCKPGLGGNDCSQVCDLTCNQPDQSTCEDLTNYTTNPGGSPKWFCVCDTSYYLTVYGNCTNNNYCLNNNCDTEATCLGKPPSYQCTCNSGFTGSGTKGNCTDINECTSNTHNCNPNAECINEVPGFKCSCISPWVGDGTTCSLNGGGSNTPSGGTSTTMILPEFLCYTQNTTSWHAYLTYHSLLLYNQSIPISTINQVSTSNTQQSYPGQTTVFISGRHVAFMVPNPVSSTGNYVLWNLDGNYLEVYTTINDWISYMCPLDIQITIPITTKCPADIPTLQTTITTNLNAFLSSIKSTKGITTNGESGHVIVTLPSTCTTTPSQVPNAEGLVTATVSSAPSVQANPYSGANAMDLVFDSLVDGSFVTILDTTSAQIVPKILSDVATIDTSNISLVVGSPIVAPPTQSAAEIDVFGKEVSWFSFVMVIIPIALVVASLVAIIAVCIWSKRKRAQAELI